MHLCTLLYTVNNFIFNQCCYDIQNFKQPNINTFQDWSSTCEQINLENLHHFDFIEEHLIPFTTKEIFEEVYKLVYTDVEQEIEIYDVEYLNKPRQKEHLEQSDYTNEILYITD
jgi:hypothetical protein